jgi:hypothetical protein
MAEQDRIHAELVELLECYQRATKQERVRISNEVLEVANCLGRVSAKLE